MADDTKYETTLAVEEDENSELSGVTDEKSGRQDYGLVVSENGERPVAVQIEDVDQDHYEGQSGEEILTSKCTQNKKISEEQEEIVRDEDDGTESSEGDSDSDSDDSDDSDSDDFWAWFFWGEDGGEEKQEETDREESLFKTIENDDFPIVQGKLTAKSIMSCGRNPLLVAIKVTEKLHARAKKKEPEKAGFEDLANRVEEFTLRFMDPLKYDSDQREAFSKHSGTQVILETAIKLKQKKFFDHPIILELMTAMWYGGNDNLKSLSSWWLLLNIWCLFEVVLFPISFFAAFVLDLCCPITDIYSRYKDFFSIPYFTFVRDMASYLVLLGVHLVICFEPSQLSFSGLEWAILMFFLGRLLMEFHQVANKRTRRKYLSDRWNFFDIAMLVFYFCVILPMRIATWTDSESVSNNRTLQIAECFYGFNAMLLVFRAFGSILETIKGVGTIQIALSHIIRDAGVVVLHFAAITLAFSSTITKIFVSEVSFRKGNTTEEDSMCSDAGMRCWWKITTHLGLSLLELSDGLDFFKSVDSFSYVISRVFFAAYLVLALLLLINMLIALLSNTYQRVENNSRNEWAFQKAITIQTYRYYHPIPVPFNIVTISAKAFSWLYNKCKGVITKTVKGRKTSPENETDGEDLKREENEADEKAQEKKFKKLNLKHLLDRYRLKYGDTFPPTQKVDQLLDDTENTESMVSQLLYRTFTKQQSFDEAILAFGQKAWEAHSAIKVDGLYLTCQPLGVRSFLFEDNYGARYLTPFSEEFPHFEVMIVETGETKWLGLGVVFKDYDTTAFPGWRKGTVGYHTDDRKIFIDEGYSHRETSLTGCAAVRRGDVIRCTVLFQEKQCNDGKLRVPVQFFENGSKVIPRDKVDTYIEYDPSEELYPYVAFKYANTVLAKMCPREDIDYQCSKLQKVTSGLEAKLAALDENMKSQCSKLQETLDAVLLKLGENKR